MSSELLYWKYYQSSDELEKENGIKYFNNKVSDNTMSRATINPEAGRAILFDDKRFRDRSVVLDIDFDLYVKKVDLKLTDKFNDKTSSILIWNRMKPNYYYGPSYIPSYSVLGKNLRTCLICFEDKYCQGKVLYCVAPHTGTEDFTNYSTAGHKDWNLKDIGWGDKISSVIFRIITTEDIQNGIYKPH